MWNTWVRTFGKAAKQKRESVWAFLSLLAGRESKQTHREPHELGLGRPALADVNGNSEFRFPHKIQQRLANYFGSTGILPGSLNIYFRCSAFQWVLSGSLQLPTHHFCVSLPASDCFLLRCWKCFWNPWVGSSEYWRIYPTEELIYIYLYIHLIA